jgi:agmatine deiminase
MTAQPALRAASPLAPIPAEWARHKAIWTAWPSHANLWQEDLSAAQDEVEGLIRLLAEGEAVKVLACNGKDVIENAHARIGDVAEIIPIPFGDIWLRDTGPIFESGAVRSAPSAAASGTTARAHLFRFNGWGGKYVLQNDDGVNIAIAEKAGVKPVPHNFILEGGSIEMDGNGLCLTTRQCLLNTNRNPGWTEAKAESLLKESLGVSKILWLNDGLLNDHTDGHIDNIARFIAPGKVVCQTPNGKDDPNAAILYAIEEALRKMTDAAGKPLEVVTIPSPGRVEDEDGEPIAASHMNFVIGNSAVPVPTYNERGEEAVAALKLLFPTREVVGLPSSAILTGGGSFHCITQQQPE